MFIWTKIIKLISQSVVKEMESKKVALGQKIKNMRKTLTMEVNSWVKPVSKCAVKGRLTNAKGNHLMSSAELYQDTIMRQQAIIKGALKDMIVISGSFDENSKETDAWRIGGGVHGGHYQVPG